MITIFKLFTGLLEQHTFMEARTSSGMAIQKARMLKPNRDHSKPSHAFTTVKTTGNRNR